PLPRRGGSKGGLGEGTVPAPAQVPDRPQAVERGTGEGLGGGMRQAGGRGNQRLPGDPGAAGRGDVRLPVRRHAGGPARATGRGAGAGGPGMSAQPITLIEAITQALAWEIAHDDSVVVLGEDVGVNGGVFRATAGLQQKFGDQRVLDTPLDETTIAGLTVGMASQGMKPVAEAQFDGFMYPMVDFIVCHAARMRYRTRGRLSCPMVLRVPWGGGIRAPEHHSEANEAIFTNVPGLRVVMPS